MSTIATIKKVIAAGILDEELCEVPSRGATPEEIKAEEAIVGRAFNADYVEFLKTWNGIGLEVIRFFGCGEALEESGRLGEFQIENDDPDQLMIIGSDPAGVVYFQAKDGTIWMFDAEDVAGTDEETESSDVEEDGDDSEVEGDIEQIADSLEDFVVNLIFGEDSDQFIDDEWKEELIAKGILKS